MDKLIKCPKPPLFGENRFIEFRVPDRHHASRAMVEVVVEVISWINKNLEEEINVDVISQKSGYTRWHFQRQFKEIAGMALADYVRSCRMLNATSALIYTDAKMMQIAIDNAYSTQQHFNRRIQKEFGITPLEIRRRYFGNHSFLRRSFILLFQGSNFRYRFDFNDSIGFLNPKFFRACRNGNGEQNGLHYMGITAQLFDLKH